MSCCVCICNEAKLLFDLVKNALPCPFSIASLWSTMNMRWHKWEPSVQKFFMWVSRNQVLLFAVPLFWSSALSNFPPELNTLTLCRPAGYVCNPSQSGETVTDFDRNLISRFFNKNPPHVADIHNLCGTTFYGGDRIRPKFGRAHKSRSSKIQQLQSHLICRQGSVTEMI